MKQPAEDWLEKSPEQREVCTHENCPYPKHPTTTDCGNHEEWMT